MNSLKQYIKTNYILKKKVLDLIQDLEQAYKENRHFIDTISTIEKVKELLK